MKTIAIIGYGHVGKNLASSFSKANYQVIICSDNCESGAQEYTAMSYTDGIQNADAVAIAIPYHVTEQVLAPYAEALNGKILIDCTNPLNEDWSPMDLGHNTSGSEQIAQRITGAKVVKAFNTIFADVMPEENHDRRGHKITAFVASDDSSAKAFVLALVEAIGLSPLDVGPLSCARYLEAMAHLNIQIAVGQQGGTKAAFVYHQG